ncbi:MAG: adenylate/guanylate cyclase domain-containing protein [bacterium]|nr:adenylate/guanylate cyclase domain-containing protein [bacterium]
MNVDKIKSYAWLAIPVILSVILYGAGFFGGVNRMLSDVLYPSYSVDESIVIISIDDDSLAELGQWPWPRGLFAELLGVLESVNPEVVAIDVLFAEPSSRGQSDDATLAKALSDVAYHVVMPVFGELTKVDNQWLIGRTVGPLPIFRELVSLGHANLVIDRDGVVRMVPLLVTTETGEQFSSFAHEAIGKNTDAGTIRVPFAGPTGSVMAVSFADMLRGRVSLPEGARVFVGAVAPSLHDEQQTPVSRGVAMSGVEIQAQIANSALGNLALVDVSTLLNVLLVLISALAPILLFVFLTRARSAFIFSLGFSVVVVVSIVLIFQSGYIVSVVHPLLAVALGMYSGFSFRYRSVNEQKRFLKEVMGKYVSRDVLREVLARPELLTLGGEDRDVTILFSDVRGFTTLSESLSPSALVDFLNRYLTRMTDIILGLDGVVDKYIGDAIMAFWGAPLQNDDHALDAIVASLDMIDSLREFNEAKENENSKDIDIGIGLNTGEVVVGNMGSQQRFDYTVMGDAVNLAARLEGQTKTYGIHLLISENTKKRITEETRTEYGLQIRELDRIQVKGKNEPVVVFQVVDRHDVAFVTTILDDFNKARKAYYEGKWRICLDICELILAKGSDGPTNVFKTRAEEFLKNPPEDWQGVYRLTSK